MTNRTRNLVIGAAVALLVAFLLGYIPQYQRASRLQNELRTAQERVQVLERDARLHQARELAHLMHLEVARKNYGLASQHAARFFSHIQELAGQEQDASVKQGLENVLMQRDAVLTGLAQADPAVDERVRQLVDRVQELTRRA